MKVRLTLAALAAMALTAGLGGTAQAAKSRPHTAGPAVINVESCAGASFCVASGYNHKTGKLYIPLAEAWNGKTWRGRDHRQPGEHLAQRHGPPGGRLPPPDQLRRPGSLRLRLPALLPGDRVPRLVREPGLERHRVGIRPAGAGERPTPHDDLPGLRQPGQLHGHGHLPAHPDEHSAAGRRALERQGLASHPPRDPLSRPPSGVRRR